MPKRLLGDATWRKIERLRKTAAKKLRDKPAKKGGKRNSAHRQHQRWCKMTQPQLENLRRLAILILQTMQATLMPLQMRASRIEGKEGPSPLRNQDNIPLNFELYMTGNILFNAVFGILKTCVENGDEMARLGG